MQGCLQNDSDSARKKGTTIGIEYTPPGFHRKNPVTAWRVYNLLCRLVELESRFIGRTPYLSDGIGTHFPL